MSNIYKLSTILISTFLILCSINIKESSSKILDIKTPAKQVIIYDHEVDEVLFEKNADQLMKPASMAKVMTSYIVFDRIKDKSLMVTLLLSSRKDLDPPILQALSETKKVSNMFKELSLILSNTMYDVITFAIDAGFIS